jgi:hypothetical protein
MTVFARSCDQARSGPSQFNQVVMAIDVKEAHPIRCLHSNSGARRQRRSTMDAESKRAHGYRFRPSQASRLFEELAASAERRVSRVAVSKGAEPSDIINPSGRHNEKIALLRGTHFCHSPWKCDSLSGWWLVHRSRARFCWSIFSREASFYSKTFQFADTGDDLMTGEWPVIWHLQNWGRDDWPMPKFIRRDPLGKRVPRELDGGPADATRRRRQFHPWTARSNA